MIYLIIYIIGYVLNYYWIKWCFLKALKIKSEDWGWSDVKQCALFSTAWFIMFWVLPIAFYCHSKPKPPRWL